MIRKSIIKRKIRKSGRKRLSESSPGYFSAKSYGILYTSGDLAKHNAIKEFIKTLELPGRSIDILTYLPKGNENHEFLFDYFTSRDVNIWGKFTNEKLERFVRKKFDFLFCADFEKNCFIRYALSQSKAKCRVGYYSEEDNIIFELQIKTLGKNHSDLLAEMFRYVKNLS